MALIDGLRKIVVPDLPEPLSERHLRRACHMLVWIGAVLIVLNTTSLLWAVSQARSEVARAPALLFLPLNLGGHVLYMGLNMWAERRASQPGHFRLVAHATAWLGTWTGVISLWLMGSVTHFPVLLMLVLLIAAFRTFYDFRIGLSALLACVVQHGALVGLEIAGVVTKHAGLPDLEHPYYASGGAQLATLAPILAGYAMAWLGASYLANRYNASEHALRQVADARERLAEQLDRMNDATQSNADAARPLRGELSGTVFAGRYELYQLLGAGGTGEVYLGHEAGREVAIKILHAHLGQNPRGHERFRREVELTSRVPAPHAPAVLDSGVSPEGRCFIAMEYVRGTDLAEVLRRRTPPVEEALALIDRIAAALDAAHQVGVVHRDLKPHNVLLLSGTADPEVRLLDFGIARVLSELVGENDAHEHTLTQTAAVLGTPGYLSPEQARGQRDAIGPHTDVFALGAIAYLALTGRRAFPSRTADGAIYEALYTEPVPPSQQRASLPAAVDEVLALALAKDPARRYQKASELATDLRAAVEGRLPSAVSSRARALRPTG